MAIIFNGLGHQGLQRAVRCVHRLDCGAVTVFVLGGSRRMSLVSHTITGGENESDSIFERSIVFRCCAETGFFLKGKKLCGAQQNLKSLKMRAKRKSTEVRVLSARTNAKRGRLSCKKRKWKLLTLLSATQMVKEGDLSDRLQR